MYTHGYMHVSIYEVISYIVIKLQDIISIEKYMNSDIFILFIIICMLNY
jgi:hypothetical protein